MARPARSLYSSRSSRSGRGPLLAVLAGIVLLAAALVLWGSLRLGPAPAIEILSDREAIGAATRVTATFVEPSRGLGTVRLELVQGERTEPLGERSFARAGSFSPTAGNLTPATTLEATVGRQSQSWLAEGEATLRATATRMAGPLRGAQQVVVEKKLPVRLRPPRLELLSQQHYVRQGGAGIVVFRVGEGALRSGVRAGNVESLSYPKPNGGEGERFALFALPWEDANPDVKVFAEDAAGNRVELPFVTLFKPAPPSTDTIEIDEGFLARVVPAIASQTPGFDATGSLLDQYLVINREVRKANLAQVAALAEKSEPRFLWSGPFIQMKNTQRFANFAQRRTYVYDGKVIDHQTHLGLDLASNAQAEVPAANSGKVVYADWLGIYGNAVIVDHGFGLMSLYGHLSSLSVKPGDEVKQGQTVARSGATGLAGGDHLHLEVFVQGKSVDPFQWLDAHWIQDNLATKMPVPGV